MCTSLAAMSRAFLLSLVLLFLLCTPLLADRIALEVHSPQLLARLGLEVSTADFAVPLVQGRSCSGELKFMTAERSCRNAKMYEQISFSLDRRGVRDWEYVPVDEDYRGRIAIVASGGDCDVHVAILEAERAGAHGVILINKASGDALPYLMGNRKLPTAHIPAATITHSTAQMLLELMNTTPVVISMCQNVNRVRYV